MTLRLPRRTVRLRLTAVYGSLFLLSGAALLAVTYLLVSHSLPTGPPRATASPGSGLRLRAPAGNAVFVGVRAAACHFFTGTAGSPAQLAARAQRCFSAQRALEL